jgi:WD40-like Beta Propeller Repeat
MSSGENDQLNSWKAIASYLGRDVRTVQFWEKEQALPVHRQRHSKLASVFAYRSELDQWLQDRTDRPKLGAVRQTRPTADSAAAQPVLVNGKAAASPLPSLTETPVDGDPPLTGFRQQRRPAFDKWKAPTIIVLVSAVVSWIVYWNHERRVTLPEARTVPITTLPGVETMPAFSPDGRHIAYVRAEHERRNPNLWRKLPGPSSIYVKLVEAGTELRLTRGRATDSFPAWSPDGQYIAFFRNAPGASGYYIVSALGGPERRVPGNAGDVSAGLDWLPDGKGLIVSEVSEGSHGSPLTAVSIDTGDRRILTSPPNTAMGDIYPIIFTRREMACFYPGSGIRQR